MSLGLESHSFDVAGTRFDVLPRYQPKEAIGEFASFSLCAAQDTATKSWVGIRKSEALDSTISIRRVLREIRILKELNHENITNITQIFAFDSIDAFHELYVVTDLATSGWTDLNLLIKSPQALSIDHIQFFMYQIMRGMKYVHSAQVVHRDLKPRNVLVNEACDVKIADFSQARVVHQDPAYVTQQTEYVCTRWYRAPEILCSWSNYTTALDIWSMGCILVEMFSRQPLLPGRNTLEQLQLIVVLLGVPDDAGIVAIKSEKARKFIEKNKNSERKPLRAQVKNEEALEHPNVLDLAAKMLVWNPADRIAIESAISHPFFDQLHYPDDEPTREPLKSWASSPYELGANYHGAEADVLAILRKDIFLEILDYFPEKREALLPALSN